MDKPIFKKTNLQWIVDYDYERSACHCDDCICRCTTIDRAWVDNVHVNDVVKELYSKHSRDDSCIDKYCFNRICYAFQIYDKYLYEIKTGAGYYGEEVYGVYFENEEKIFNAYYEMLALNTPIEKIQYCLNLEYGYLIDCVKSASAVTIDRVSPNEIYCPQIEYFQKVDMCVIEEYKNINIPVAVCVIDGNHYRLVDGYHRFVANKNKEKIDIVVLG